MVSSSGANREISLVLPSTLSWPSTTRVCWSIELGVRTARSPPAPRPHLHSRVAAAQRPLTETLPTPALVPGPAACGSPQCWRGADLASPATGERAPAALAARAGSGLRAVRCRLHLHVECQGGHPMSDGHPYGVVRRMRVPKDGRIVEEHRGGRALPDDRVLAHHARTRKPGQRSFNIIGGGAG